MSDYLGNLVARSFAPIPALRPNIPSRFESPSKKSPIDGPAELDVPTDSRLAPQHPAESTENSNRPIVAAPHEPHHEPPAQFTRHPPADAVKKISPGKSNPSFPVAAVSTSPRNLVFTPHQPDTIDRVPRIHPATADHLPALTRRAEVESDFSTDLRPRPASVEQSFHSDAARLVSSSAHTENRKSSSRENSAPPSAIHVTIGRVEIKATLPPPAPSRAASGKNPGMSLESYLQRRSHGGRHE